MSRSRSCWMAVVLGGLVVTLASCAGKRPPDAAPEAETGVAVRFALDLVAHMVLPTGDPLPGDSGHTVGGLSGCARDPSTGRWLVVSDERGRPRVFDLEVRPDGERLLVAVNGVRRMADRRPGAGTVEVIDLEGIVALPGGDVLASSEGDTEAMFPVPPSITRHSPDGRLVDRLVVPDWFLPATPGATPRGMGTNLAFESLTRTPDGRLLSASEGPLAQDAAVPGFGESAPVRIIEYVPEGATWRPARQFAYGLSPVTLPDGFGASTLSTGVAELLALDEDRVLVLERSYVAERGPGRRGFNVVRLFEVSLHSADDVSGVAALRGRHVRTLDKRLILDLDEVKPRLAVDLPTLENFEAMCFGPRLADGSASLLLISDNNFNRRQKTAFLLFRVREG